MSFRYLLFIIALLINPSYASQTKAVVCDQEYVLCTSASCIPDPRHEKFAICSCDVEKGPSVGYKSCEKRKPKMKSFKVKQLISTFSFKQFNTKKNMTCPRGKPWTNCLDAPCTVNPLDNKKAICSCEIKHDQVFVTLGGTCDADTCSNAFWSGAMISSSTALRDSLLKNISCPKKKN